MHGRVILGLGLVCLCTSMEAHNIPASTTSGLVDSAFSGCVQSGVGTRAKAFARCPNDLLSESGAGPDAEKNGFQRAFRAFQAANDKMSGDRDAGSAPIGSPAILGQGQGEGAGNIKEEEIWKAGWLAAQKGTQERNNEFVKKCRQCSPECRTEHDRGSRKHAACELPDFSPEGMKRIMNYSWAVSKNGCATVSKTSNKDSEEKFGDNHQCTSCPPGRTLFMSSNLRRTGHCHGENKIHQSCTGLDSNSGFVNGMANSLCTKRIGSSMELWIKRGLVKDGKRGSAVWKHFQPLFNQWGIIRVFYVLEKYIACRGGSCATKKVVKCRKVCKNGDATHGPSLCSSKYCKEPFGSFVVREVAMLA